MPDRIEADWWNERIEAYVDGLLEPAEERKLEGLIATDRRVALQVELARSMRSEFRAMAGVVCPESVTRSVMAEVRRDVFREAAGRVREFVRGTLTSQLRPALAVLTLIAVVVVSSRIGGEASPETDPAVAQALGDVKWTLAYLSDVSRQTGTRVRSQALEPLLLNPVEQAMNTFSDN